MLDSAGCRWGVCLLSIRQTESVPPRDVTEGAPIGPLSPATSPGGISASIVTLALVSRPEIQSFHIEFGFLECSPSSRKGPWWGDTPQKGHPEAEPATPASFCLQRLSLLMQNEALILARGTVPGSTTP